MFSYIVLVGDRRFAESGYWLKEVGLWLVLPRLIVLLNSCLLVLYTNSFILIEKVVCLNVVLRFDRVESTLIASDSS